MAQGAIKKSAKPASTSHKAKKLAAASGGAPKRGARVTKPPRKAKAIRSHANTDKMMRQFTSGMTAKTEKLLGERAGHLELIGPGKKAKKDGKGKGKSENIGGSRRYG